MVECGARDETGTLSCEEEAGSAHRLHRATVYVDNKPTYPQWPNDDFAHPADERERIRNERTSARQTIKDAANSVRMDPHTHARRDDPSTSHEAAQRTRRKDGQYLALLAAYRMAYPVDLTCEEAGQLAGNTKLWRRASDLHKDGLIEYVVDPASPGGYVERPLESGRPGKAYRAVPPW